MKKGFDRGDTHVIQKRTTCFKPANITTCVESAGKRDIKM